MYLYAFTLYSPSHLVIPQPLCHLNHLSGGTMAFCCCPKVNPGSSFRAHPTTHGAHALRSGPPFIGAGRIWYTRLSTWSVGYLRIPLHKWMVYIISYYFKILLPQKNRRLHMNGVSVSICNDLGCILSHCFLKLHETSMKPRMAWVNQRSSRLRWGHLHPFHTLQIRCWDGTLLFWLGRLRKGTVVFWFVILSHDDWYIDDV